LLRVMRAVLMDSTLQDNDDTVELARFACMEGDSVVGSRAGKQNRAKQPNDDMQALQIGKHRWSDFMPAHRRKCPTHLLAVGNRATQDKTASSIG
jgi:hypothetical protein